MGARTTRVLPRALGGWQAAAAGGACGQGAGAERGALGSRPAWGRWDAAPPRSSARGKAAELSSCWPRLPSAHPAPPRQHLGAASHAVPRRPEPRAAPAAAAMARGPGWVAAALLLLLLLLLRAPGSETGCAELGRCCRGRDLACVSTGWRPDRSHGACYCDQACARTMDCCHDYPQACPEVPCAVSEWSNWSGCAEPCQATYRVRRRHVVQEPRNGGETCPHLEEKAGCMEYWNQQGAECKQSLIPALITTGGYGKARKRRAASKENEGAGYCVEFQLMAITEGCLQGNSSYTQWMQYLSKGHTVCVECQHPALDSRSLHCSGDGSGSKKNQLLHWQAMGNPWCRGTWRRLRQLDTCSCPSVHSFLFI